MMLTFMSHSVRDTESLGEIIGEEAAVGDAIMLRGEMGAGKTALARGIARGAQCTVSARSPTFIIVAEYPGQPTVFHCDLYRIATAEDVRELCLEENLQRGALVVEWPENGHDALPTDALLIDIVAVGDGRDERQVSMTHNGELSAALLDRVRRRLEVEGRTTEV